MNNPLFLNCSAHLHKLCGEISDRSVGSAGNRKATRYFQQRIALLGWQTETQDFSAIDWIDGGASLRFGEERFAALVSPYSLGCTVEAPLVTVATVAALEGAALSGKILLLHGEIAAEQLMPKNFVFFNPPEHQRIIFLLETKAPAAIVCATGRNAALAGGVYPFPLIEDGDFDIPSVYMTEEEGSRLLPHAGETLSLRSTSTRLPSSGCNVIARRGNPAGKRLVVTAHIDAKKGTPGAIDNASGVAVLLLLAELLKDYAGEHQVELVALNGEDYYAVPGQMLYLRANQGRFGEMLLNINLDGAGYRHGKSAYSTYDLPPALQKKVSAVMGQFPGIEPGGQWYQGDHSIFIQNGCPAVAVSSMWFTEHIDSQEITHTPKDNLAIVDPNRLVEVAQALGELVQSLQSS